MPIVVRYIIIDNAGNSLVYVIVFYIVQSLAVIDTKLSNHSNSANNRPMANNIVTIYLLQNSPKFEPVVDCFMSTRY